MIARAIGTRCNPSESFDVYDILRGLQVRRPWGACWMVAEGGEGENPLPFSLTAPKRGGGWGGGGG